tara:strand:- start:45 stop:500 length:456 start_codon:yes stop_codon:yes gene_type:complete
MDIKKDTYDKFSVGDIYVSGIYERNLLSDIYFSKKNTDLIQLKIINTIQKKHNYKISKQSHSELLIIMRSIYMDNSTNYYKTKDDLKKEITRLNKLIIDYCVNNIVNNMKEYELYLEKIDNPSNIIQINPIDRSENVSSKGEKTLELKPFF